jgi:hypothetical protein
MVVKHTFLQLKPSHTAHAVPEDDGLSSRSRRGRAFSDTEIDYDDEIETTCSTVSFDVAAANVNFCSVNTEDDLDPAICPTPPVETCGEVASREGVQATRDEVGTKPWIATAAQLQDPCAVNAAEAAQLLEIQAAQLRLLALAKDNKIAAPMAHEKAAVGVSPSSPPKMLSIVGFGSVDGVYNLMPGEVVNDHETWRKEFPIPMVVYTTRSGRWAVTTPDGVAKNKNFILTNERHDDHYPHEQIWGKSLENGGFQPLDAVCVSVVEEYGGIYGFPWMY